MVRGILILVVSLAVSSLLSACSTAPVQSQVSSRWCGHPVFVLQNVSMAADVQPTGEVASHCLPDPLYAKLLQVELRRGLRHSGLDRGTGRRIPVSVTLTERRFGDGSTAESDESIGYLKGRLTVGDHRYPLFMADSPKPAFHNVGPKWMWQQHLIPALAVSIINGLREVGAGRPFSSAPHADDGTTAADYLGVDGASTDGLASRLSRAEVEAVAGRGAAALNALCRSRIAGARVSSG